jgi:phage-related minor tail protein
MTDSTTGVSAASSDLAASTTTLSGTLANLDGLSKAFGQSLTSAFKGAAIQGKALDTVLRSVAERLSNKALDAALSPLSSAVGGGATSLLSGLTSALGFAGGGVFSGGRVTPFASGGVVSTPTYFPMRGSTGLMGEAGAEAIMPLARGPDGRLGVAAGGAGGGGTHVTLNVTTPDAASFRRSEAQMTGILARAVGRGRRGL